MFLVKWRTHNLILKLFLPVEANGSRNMPLFIGACIHIHLDEANLRIT